jgi:beta-galactosidase
MNVVYLKSVLCFVVLGLMSLALSAQNNYQIDVTNVRTDVIRGHLDLGGRNPQGDTIGVNSFYLERNNQPFIPVIGEFHFSRYPHQYWDEQLKKIKAGGITVVATYVFWNLHEFTEGSFNWSGDLDVRRFVEQAGQNGLEVIVRIGPFAHGEMRNGGLPDWLYGRPIEVRTNDPAYLFYANRFYQQIGQQLKGLMFRDGGPIIGTQIENEYQHSAAPWAFTYQDAPRERTVGRRDNKITQDGVGINNVGNEFADVGRDHMKTLKELAVKAGLITPIYTATGWGRATIVEKGSVPVMAGYAFPFWSKSVAPSPFYLYKDIQQKPDYSPVSYDVTLYPSMAAELGTGMANIYSRRPRVPGESFLPMMVRTIGSGSNGLGYYMYHGGTTPSVGNFFMSEQHGLHNKSYDYQAPIGEFGNATAGFYSLKLINHFLTTFGNQLAPLYTVLPSTNDSIKANNNSTLRYAVRSDGNKGFLFMHNYQDHLETKDLAGLKIDIATKTGKVSFPETGTLTLKSGASAIFPFNMQLDGVHLYMATVQPFCRFVNNGNHYNVMVAIDGISPEMVFAGKVKVSGTGIKTTVRNGNTVVAFAHDKMGEVLVNGVSFLVLPYQTALNAYLVGNNNPHLVISNALVLNNKENISLVGRGKQAVDVAVYPAVKSLSTQGQLFKRMVSPVKSISQWQITLPDVTPNLRLVQATDRHFVLQAPDMDWAAVNDVFVTFDYRGDRGICMMQGHLQTDDLYSSKPWSVGLKRYADALKTNDMFFYFVPMAKDAPYLSYLEKEVVPDFGDKREFLEIKKPEIITEFKITIDFVGK